MTINVFEGSRRIAKLVALLWILAVSAFTLFQRNPYITVTYTKSSASGPLVLSDPSCLYGDNLREDFTVKTKRGTEAHATACYLPPKLQHGPPVGFVLDKPSSREREELQEFRLRALREAIDSHILSPTDESEIDSQWWRERWRQIREGVFWLVGGLAFLWGLTWTIGWIVRGFLGIPHRKDRRE